MDHLLDATFLAMHKDEQEFPMGGKLSVDQLSEFKARQGCLTPVTYVRGMSRRKMKPGSERKPIARKAVGLRPRRLAAWNCHSQIVKGYWKILSKNFYCMIHIVCTKLAKQSMEMSAILLSTVCPTQMTIVSGPPRSVNLPDDGSAPGPQSFQLLKEDSILPLSLKSCLYTKLQWRIVAMSARSTGIQKAGKKETEMEEKPNWKRFEELCFPDALISNFQ